MNVECFKEPLSNIKESNTKFFTSSRLDVFSKEGVLDCFCKIHMKTLVVESRFQACIQCISLLYVALEHFKQVIEICPNGVQIFQIKLRNT